MVRSAKDPDTLLRPPTGMVRCCHSRCGRLPFARPPRGRPGSVMKLRAALLFACTGLILAVAAYSRLPAAGLLVLEWSAKAAAEKPPVAVLIEMGRKDAKATAWAGTATVAGATVVHREGYRFREGDALKEPERLGGEVAPGEEEKKNPARPRSKGSPPSASCCTWPTPGPTPRSRSPPARAATRSPSRSPTCSPGSPSRCGTARRGPAGGHRHARRQRRRPRTTSPPRPTAPTARSGWPTSVTPSSTKTAGSRPHNWRAAEGLQVVRHPEFGDRLWVKSYRDGKWNAPDRRHRRRQDLVGCAVAVEARGTAWVATAPTGRQARTARPPDHRRRPSSARRRRSPAGTPATYTHGLHGPRRARPRAVPVPAPERQRSVVNSWRRRRQWAAGPACGTAGPSLVSFRPPAGPKGEVAQLFDGYRDGDYDIF